MAATVVSRNLHYRGQCVTEQIELSGLTAGGQESITMTGVTLVTPSDITLRTKTEATSLDPVLLGGWSRTASTSTLVVRFDTLAGGDLSGAVVVLTLSWTDQARQDGQSINQDNN